ncbi:gamma-butyrolactone-binding protein [Streptomyces spiroverticillatus]|uniref:Gamma-butyrolactone-binding protein n=1 Tax=Streptomyces finlayi TaxID=67296 RepID=A0A918WY89_9ACTN|nr:ScbR family autoregulator-binding transcription factor [Streptomyces finlayi]GHA11886.1 gamma-butyrolactone-binding protein [Streptomyces spiroverticillatus]GHC94750.1 gamma-butyrolactone-binding protein [Streptomyces finlayi]
MTPPTQERAQRTREALLWAAAEEFDAHGYAGAGITRILKRAGVTAGALYFHFGSKQGLADAVVAAQARTIVPRIGSDGLQRLVDITLVWAWQLQSDPLLRAGVRLAVEQGGQGGQDPSSFHSWKVLMEECLHAADRRGELREGVDPERVATFVVGACTGVQLYGQLRNGRKDLAEQVVHMWQLLLPGVAAPGKLARFDLDVRRGMGG